MDCLVRSCLESFESPFLVAEESPRVIVDVVEDVDDMAGRGRLVLWLSTDVRWPYVGEVTAACFG